MKMHEMMRELAKTIVKDLVLGVELNLTRDKTYDKVVYRYNIDEDTYVLLFPRKEEIINMISIHFEDWTRAFLVEELINEILKENYNVFSSVR